MTSYYSDSKGIYVTSWKLLRNCLVGKGGTWSKQNLQHFISRNNYYHHFQTRLQQSRKLAICLRWFLTRSGVELRWSPSMAGKYKYFLSIMVMRLKQRRPSWDLWPISSENFLSRYDGLYVVIKPVFHQANLIGWRQTLTISTANHIHFLLLARKKSPNGKRA